MAGGILPKRKITPSERIIKEIMEIIQNLTGHDNNQKLLGQLMQLSMRKLVQESRFTGEVQEYLGRAYYEHKESGRGYRNGYKPHLKTAEDRLLVQKPQVTDPMDPNSDSPETFSSQLWMKIAP